MIYSSPDKGAHFLVDRRWVSEWTGFKHPRPPVFKNAVSAFLFGGLVCLLGQLVLELFLSLGMPQQQAGNPTVAIFIFAAALLTGLGVFDSIAQVAGAGVAIPVTGFANSVTAMAIEFRREGLVQGTASKMFALAGPVIVFGVVTAFVIGIISAIL